MLADLSAQGRARGVARKALGTALGLALLAAPGCVPPAPGPAPAPAPAPVAAPAGAPPPIAALPEATYDDWLDAPATPGDWRYGAQGGGATQASFGGGAGQTRLTLRCDLASRRVALALTRAGDASGPLQSGPAQLRIRTEFAERLLEARPADGAVTAELAASDPLLDAIAFTKGRFAVETAGQEPLYVPAYPEISRVIEDCRRGGL